MLLRLYCALTQDLSHLLAPPQEMLAPPRLHCLLQVGELPTHQDVTVQVGGQRVQGSQEDALTVFSWHCEQQVVTQIHLLQRGSLLKSWHGCWDGQRTIQHGGALVIEVFLDQERQLATTPPAVLSPPPPPLVVPPDPVPSNGHHPEVVPRLSSGVPPLAAHPVSLWVLGEELTVLAGGQEVSLTDEDAPAMLVQTPPALQTEEPEGDLWMQEAQAQEAAAVPPAHIEEEERELDDEEDWEEEDWDEEGSEEETDAGEREEGEEQAPVSSSPEAPPTQDEEALLMPVPRVATFHAGTQSTSQDLLQALRSLLAEMPASTVVVDLRQHPKPSRRQPVAVQGLSKEQLRASFGARYWDRGALIQHTLHLDPPRTWRTVLTNLDDPTGVRSLLTYLEQGGSMVLLDSRAAYLESVRCAVLQHFKLSSSALTVLQEQ